MMSADRPLSGRGARSLAHNRRDRVPRHEAQDFMEREPDVETASHGYRGLGTVWTAHQSPGRKPGGAGCPTRPVLGPSFNRQSGNFAISTLGKRLRLNPRSGSTD